MTALTVSRMTASLRDSPGSGADARRVDRIVRGVAEHGLADRLHRLPVPRGEWCVRRVRAAVAYDPAAHEATTQAEWADRVLAALARSLDGAAGGPAGDVVHYPTHRDGVADLVASLATGHDERAWAWRQLDLLAPPPPPREAVLAVLGRHPEHAVPVLRRCVDAGLATALHRLLGPAGWTELAVVVARACDALDAVVAWLGGDIPADDGLRSEAGAAVAATDPADDADLAWPDVVGTSPLAARLAGCGVRPDPVTARAWAVLAVADLDPFALRRRGAGSLVRTAATRLAGAAPRRLGLAAPTAGGAAEPASRGAAPGRSGQPTTAHASGSPTGEAAGRAGASPSARRAGQAAAPDPADPSDPAEDAMPVASTVWGGLLFLLNSAPAAGVPGVLDADERLSGRPTRWLLHAVAQRLVPLCADDPAALALAGLAPGQPAPAGDDPTDSEHDALDAVADAWTTATLALLPADADAAPPAARLIRLARRRAEISGEPGWIEVDLDLDDVDVDVRVAGLDLDPGWVPWLGAVVRFRYG